MRLALTKALPVAVALCFWASQKSLAQELFCGLGPPPGSPDYLMYSDRFERQRQTLGYVFLCDASMRRYNFAAWVSPVDKAMKQLSFTPTELEGTKFAGLRLVGAISDHIGNRGAGTLRRVFYTQSGDIMTLHERDMTTGGHIDFLRDSGWVTLRGQKAQVTEVRAPSRRQHIEVTWLERGRLFEVTMDRELADESTYSEIKAYAESLP